MKHQGTAADRALDTQCAAIRKLFEKADLDEVATRYQIGAIVAKVRDEKGTYGERGVHRLAATLKKHRGTLYRYAAVADLGSWRELRLLAKKTDCHGDLLTWRHWWELARVPTAWKRWHAKTLAEGWTARQLGELLDSVVAGRAARDADDADDTTEAAFAESLRAVQRFDVEVTGALAAVLDRIERVPAGDRPKQVPELLARGMDLMEAAHTKALLLHARMQRLTGKASGGKMDTPRREN